MKIPLAYPPGDAERIANARLHGMRPAETVLVVLCARQECSNPQVFPELDVSYRWDFVKGLRVIVLKKSMHDVSELLHDIECSEPSQLDLIDVETRQGWLVLFTRPLRTVRWPTHQVEDWLGSGEWHRELQRAKDLSIQLFAYQQKSQQRFSPEPVWS